MRPSFSLLMLAVAGPALSQPDASSPGPQSVSVTIYRNPERQPDEEFDLNWLNGYALISETRHVEVPAGEGEIRFEGVAGGIIPESAIVTGLPDGIIEKNQDAYLLSPGSLLDRSLGRRVHLRRTSEETGAVREQDAVVRTGKDGAVVLQTAEGFEALRCTGISETILYDEVPPGLSAKPTLSVRTRSAREASATVTLSYLASGFDWQANYVATLNPEGDRMDLFAWVTLANGDETSFVDADAQTIAGIVNREEEKKRRGRPVSGGIGLRCWPSATTSDISLHGLEQLALGQAGALADEEAIVITGLRASLASSQNLKRNSFEAVQEELGDLKLYRIPQPVTVAAKSQKQVALLRQPHVKVNSFYRARIADLDDAEDSDPIRPNLVLKARNTKRDGLGLPLPAGGVSVFQRGYARPVLIGLGSVADKAIDEDVEVELGEAAGLMLRVDSLAENADSEDYRLTVSNDRRNSVRVDVEFGEADEPLVVEPLSRRVKLGHRNGKPVWSVKVPANGTVSVDLRVPGS